MQVVTLRVRLVPNLLREQKEHASKSAKKRKIRDVPDEFFVLKYLESVRKVFSAGFEWFCTRLTFLHEIPGTDTATQTCI